MKKDRNSFFSGYGFNVQNPGMNPNMMQGMNPNMMPPQVSANSNFYAGPAQGPMMQGQGGMMPGQGPMVPSQGSMPSDIDSRLSKIERKLGRLEARVSKIEGDTGGMPGSYEETDLNYSNSMYMV